MIRYLLHFPKDTRQEQVREFMERWRQAEGLREQIDVAESFGVTVERLPRPHPSPAVRAALARAR